MTYAIDFADLKSKVSITDVLGFLGIDHLTTQGETLRGTCPLCQTSNPRGFVVTPAKGTWYCFGEKKGGDIIRLTALHDRTQDKAAAQKLAAHFLNGAGKAADNAPHPSEQEGTRKPAGFDPREYQRSLQPTHDALDGLGIAPRTIERLGGGYAAKGIMRGRLALPIQRDSTAILGFVGLALKGETPELLYPKDFNVPYFLNMQNVGEGPLCMVTEVPYFLHLVDNGTENIVCSLQPLTRDALTCLITLMKERGCTELELE